MKAYSNTMKESIPISFDIEADYQTHLETLKDEFALQDQQNPNLTFDEMTELFYLLEYGEEE